MTSLNCRTWRRPFQLVCEYDPTRSWINFPNCVLSFFLELCNILRIILIDNTFEITPKKKSKGLTSGLCGSHLQISSTKNSAKKEIVSFATCNHALCFYKTASHSSLCKSAISCWIISWYTFAVIVVSKKLVPLHVCNSWPTKIQFFGDSMTLFKNVRALLTPSRIILRIYVAI